MINLSPDKGRVFEEAFRALKPGGRLIVSDIVLTEELPESVRRSERAYVACVAGAILKDEYLKLIERAGFQNVRVVEEKVYRTNWCDEVEEGTVLSVTVYGVKKG